VAVVAVLAAAAAVITAIVFAWPGRPAFPARPAHPARAAFPPLAAAAAPASWRNLTLPDQTAVLSYPPSLRPLAGDTDAVSAASLSPDGRFQLYLNATPRQGTERLRNWALFRVNLLRSDDAATARQIAAAQDVTFRGGTGSCVIDVYRTRIGGHLYQEIACLVQGRTSASVIVATAPADMWAQERPLLLRAVGAYLVR
jgi:hypothetical protein